jgi:hypothetical protein
MRALVVFAVLVAAGCGAAPVRHAEQPATDVSWPPVAEAARMQWYRSVERADAVPVTLSEGGLDAALDEAAAASGVTLVRTHYLPLEGGTAELVVEPTQPIQFAENAAAKVGPVLGPLGRETRPYLVTVVDEQHRPLLVLGWTRGDGGTLGEGGAWQADGIHSSAIIGQPVTLSAQKTASNRLLQAPSARRVRGSWLNHEPELRPRATK